MARRLRRDAGTRSAEKARAEQQQEAEGRRLVRSKDWPDAWPARDAHIWLHRRIPVERAVRWADAGWSADLVLDFLLNGSEEWADLGLDPALLEAEVLTSRLPVAPGDDWTRCRVGSLASVYAFESRGWSADDVAQVGGTWSYER